MNIIDAFVKAQGKNIGRKGKSNYFPTASRSLSDFIFGFNDADICADDWKIVKEKKVVTGAVKWEARACGTHPRGDINYNWSNLVGKTTTITIEWEE